MFKKNFKAISGEKNCNCNKDQDCEDHEQCSNGNCISACALGLQDSKAHAEIQFCLNIVHDLHSPCPGCRCIPSHLKFAKFFFQK